MAESRTSLTLLGSLLEPGNEAAWERFDSDYRPLVVRFALHIGLCRDDAEEVAQRTLVAFSKAYREGKYDRDKGRLRHWLLGIARRAIASFGAERARQPIPASQRTAIGQALSSISDEHALTVVWEEQWQEHVIGVCLQRARGRFTTRDMRIFEMLAFDRLSVDEVARSAGVSEAAAYQVKHRVLAFLRTIKDEIENAE